MSQFNYERHVVFEAEAHNCKENIFIKSRRIRVKEGVPDIGKSKFNNNFNDRVEDMNRL